MRKFLRAAAAPLAAMMLFTGCLSSGKPEETSGDSASETCPESETLTETASETEESPDGPVKITTPGGAVLVGIIGHDDDGWMFTAEREIDLTLTQSDGNRTDRFGGISVFRMLDNGGDGVSKVLYEGKTVTVSGLITVMSGTDVLYLIPYKVERGKTADKSCAAPDLEAPGKLSECGYDTDALPAEMSPHTDGGVYSYNYYMLSDEALNTFGNTFAELYVDFVNAYLNYETDIVCPTVTASDSRRTEMHLGDYLRDVVYYEFPVFAADAEFVGYDRETRTLTWKYSVAKSEHDSIAAEYKSIADGYLENVKPSDSDAVKAQKVYHNFSPKMTYDFDVLETRVHSEPYYAFKLNRGICTTFAKAYAALLTQVGVKCTVACGEYTTGPHAWDVITVDGVNYFADPTFELSRKDGTSYFYFGESYGNRINDGIIEGSIYIGRYGSTDAKSCGISEQNIRILPTE